MTENNEIVLVIATNDICLDREWFCGLVTNKNEGLPYVAKAKNDFWLDMR